MLSLISHLGLVCLGVSFFSKIIAERNGHESKRELKLKEDDILKAARVVLPAVNLVISKGREVFSGEPSTTLKVAPLLLLGSDYGHFVTLKRLSGEWRRLHAAVLSGGWIFGSPSQHKNRPTIEAKSPKKRTGETVGTCISADQTQATATAGGFMHLSLSSFFAVERILPPYERTATFPSRFRRESTENPPKQ